VNKIIDRAAFERGRECAEGVIRAQGFDRAKMNIEMTIEAYKRVGEYTDFDRGAESVIAARENK
jgi:hypothetical protein